MSFSHVVGKVSQWRIYPVVTGRKLNVHTLVDIIFFVGKYLSQVDSRQLTLFYCLLCGLRTSVSSQDVENLLQIDD